MPALTDATISKVVSEVLSELRRSSGAKSNGHASSPPSKPGRYGVFEKVSDAVAAAVEAQRAFEKQGTDARAKAVACIRKICIEQARPLGAEEFHETKIGRLDHKIEKLVVAGERTPGVEFLQTSAQSGTNGLTLTEYAPFGVIGTITPVTHSLPTLAGNAINMLAAGNAMVVNPHPSGARVACHGVELFNRAIVEAIGVDNLITIVSNPTLESANEIFAHRDVKLLCVTGGPAVGRAALASKKRAIVAGPGNPPVVVDATADLDNAARSIIKGGAYDNNLLCIGEKEVFAVQDIFDELMQAMERAGAVRLDKTQVELLTRVAFVPATEPPALKGGQEGHGRLTLNKDLIGKDPAELAQRAGFTLPRKTELLFAETDESNPFVPEEQMMPFVPFVRVPNIEVAIELAKKHEHGFKHTALIHSRNVETISHMGREMDVSIFVVNGPSMAGLGVGGEGYLSYSIATPTGEGVTTPQTFTRQRRLAIAGGMRIL